MLLLPVRLVRRLDLTWGPIEYHKKSLDNLMEAMKRTRKLCAIVIDTLGREVMIRRPFRIDPDGWPNQVRRQPAKHKGGCWAARVGRA